MNYFIAGSTSHQDRSRITAEPINRQLFGPDNEYVACRVK
jgi:hypothetical protein